MPPFWTCNLLSSPWALYKLDIPWLWCLWFVWKRSGWSPSCSPKTCFWQTENFALTSLKLDLYPVYWRTHLLSIGWYTALVKVLFSFGPVFQTVKTYLESKKWRWHLNALFWCFLIDLLNGTRSAGFAIPFDNYPNTGCFLMRSLPPRRQIALKSSLLNNRSSRPPPQGHTVYLLPHF